MDNVLNIKLNKSVSVKFIIEVNKEIGQMFASEFITLQKGKHYFIPTDSTLSLKDFTFFKINPELIDMIDVRNIDNGVATVIPLLHNVQLKDGITLGNLV